MIEQFMNVLDMLSSKNGGRIGLQAFFNFLIKHYNWCWAQCEETMDEALELGLIVLDSEDRLALG